MVGATLFSSAMFVQGAKVPFAFRGCIGTIILGFLFFLRSCSLNGYFWSQIASSPPMVSPYTTVATSSSLMTMGRFAAVAVVVVKVICWYEVVVVVAVAAVLPTLC